MSEECTFPVSVATKGKRLTFLERKCIERMLHQDIKHKEICRIVGIQPSTLYRDIKRCKGEYSAQEAHENVNRKRNLIDWEIIGKRYGLLTVIEFANIYKKRSWWRCRCDCGKDCFMSRKVLVDYCSPARELSCGCIPKQSSGPKKDLALEESSLRKYHDLLRFREVNGSCWEWRGYMQAGKVPKTSWRNKSMTVRKCMYLLMNGITYEPNPVFAKCGNRFCFNPEHITLEKPLNREFYE